MRPDFWEPPVWPGQYRPHTMTRACWCVFGIPGLDCQMTTWLFFTAAPMLLPEPVDGGPRSRWRSRPGRGGSAATGPSGCSSTAW